MYMYAVNAVDNVDVVEDIDDVDNTDVVDDIDDADDIDDIDDTNYVDDVDVGVSLCPADTNISQVTSNTINHTTRLYNTFPKLGSNMSNFFHHTSKLK